MNANYSSLDTDSNISKDILLNPVLAGHDIVFESYHTYKSYIGQTIRQDTFMTKDFEDSMVRIRAGDNTSTSSSLISGNKFIGLNINRNFGISPGYVSHPLGEREIFLDSPSRVEIFVNGMIVKVLQLDAGRQFLKDIPANQGLNDISIKITDAAGLVRIVNFSMAAEESLLRRGIWDFSFSGGKLTDRNSEEPKYTEKSLGAFSLRHGVTTWWTPGVSAQGTDQNAIEAAENLFATPIGIFKLGAAFSQSNDSNGNALQAGYVWTNRGKNDEGQRFSLGGESFSPKFLKNIYPVTFAESGNRWDWNASFSTAITDSIAAQVSAIYNHLYEAERETFQTNFEINKRFASGLFISLHYGETKSFGGNPDLIHEVGFNLNYQFDDTKSVMANYRAPSQGSEQTQIDTLYNNAEKVTSAQASHAESSDGKTDSLSASYGWQYADLAGGVSHVDPSVGQEVTRYRFNPSGSFVYADGLLGMGRQIRDAYVVMHNERDEYIYLNGDEHVNEMAIPPRSSAVLTTVQAYQRKVVNAGRSTEVDSQSGEIYHREYKVRPANKTATILTIQEEKLFTIRGILADANGKPLPYISGRILNQSTNNESKFFTDDGGNFYIESLSPAKYDFSIYGNPFDFAEIDLSNLFKGTHDVGVVKLKTKVSGNTKN